MLTIQTDNLPILQLQQYLQAAIAPRPICFASTIDKEGRVNLSPFSFFNIFSMNPPVCVFSPSRRVRDNTTKHTLENLKEVPECVINIVNYDMVQQMSLSSCEYSKDTNEFIKAGFTELPSTLVRPPRVAESPIQLECTIRDIISLGDQPGAGNLVIAQIKVIHIGEQVLNAQNKIDSAKLDLVARLGEDWYARVTPESMFQVEKPNTQLGIGFDQLPGYIKNNQALTANEKGQLANVSKLPENMSEHENLVLTSDIINAVKDALKKNDAAAAWLLIQTAALHQ
ncbi:MAG: flavin reductase family protein [Chitinophagia bacterium]|nr:flavin reductase family protein [Chitinophagia bacterium]